MPDSTSQQTALSSLLTDEMETLRSLHREIEAEFEALKSDAVATLEGITRQKSEAVAAHAQQQMKRIAWAQQLGFPPEAPITELIAAVGQTSELSTLQDALAELATSCQNKNRRNGSLILRLQDRTQGALDILRGEEPGSELYSLSGAREHHSDGRSLGKA